MNRDHFFNPEINKDVIDKFLKGNKPMIDEDFNSFIGFGSVPLERRDFSLDRNDPFESALIPIVEMNRRKRADYAADGDPFSNFREAADTVGVLGFGEVEAALFMVAWKLSRIKSMRVNGRLDDPANESVIDTYLDMAVFAVIAYALANQEWTAVTEVCNGDYQD